MAWVTRVVCDMNKGTICELGNVSAHDSEVVEVKSFLKTFLNGSVVLSLKNSHVGTMFTPLAGDVA